MYAALFAGLVLVLVPQELLEVTGVRRPDALGPSQLVGLAVVGVGAGLALWCVLAFALVGRGTPAPFDPPRHLVVTGPYRLMRNPMYVGAEGVLLGTAAFYESVTLLLFAAAFLAAASVFVVFFEEPTLMRLFGAQYSDYYHAVPRWLPRRRP